MDAMNGVRLGLLAMIAALPAWGCECGCVGHIDVRRNFTVEIQFEGKPLRGAEVKLGDHTFVTGKDGRAIIKPLPPGDYTLTARKLGILIASECSVRVSRWGRGKQELKYTMDEKPWPVAMMSGRLTGWQWDSLFKRATRSADKKEVPLAGRETTLLAFDGPDRRVTVAPDGTFDFGSMPPGLYVMQVDEPPFLPRLFRLTPDAKHPDLTLIAVDVICGGQALFFRDEVKE